MNYFEKIIKKHPRLAVISLIIIIVIVILSSIMPLLFKMLLDDAIPSGSINLFKKIVFVFGVSIVLQLLLNYILSVVSSRWINNTIYDLRKEIFSKYYDYFFNDFGKQNHYFQMVTLSDTEVIGNNFQKIFITGITSLITILIVSVYLYLLNRRLFILLIFTLPLFIVLNIKISNITKSSFESVQSSKDSLNKYINEIFRGIIFIKLYKISNYIFKSYYEKLGKIRDSSVKFASILTFFTSLSSLFAVALPFMVLIVGVRMVINGESTIGVVFAEYTYAGALLSPTMTLISLFPLIQQLKVSCERVDSILMLTKNESRNNIEYFDDPIDMLRMRNICLKYDSNSSIVVNDFSCVIKRGDIYLLEGRNGSGKTTLFSCIGGLISPYSGMIEKNRGASKISVVPSQTFLFQCSIIDNILMGITSYDKKLFYELLSITGLEKDLEKKGRNICDKIQSGECNLSTGQIQKIKLIRALLVEPDILLLDEVLSNITIEDQERILVFLKSWAKEHALLLISHDKDIIKKILNPKVIKLDEE